MGVRIRLAGGGISEIREIRGGESYRSQSDLRAHFGMGQAGRAETVEVKWHRGELQTFHKLQTNRFRVVREGDTTLVAQPFLSGKAEVSSPQK